MQKRCPHIGAVFAKLHDQKRGYRINHQRHTRHDDDDPAFYLLGVEQALHTFGGQIERHHDQRGIIDQCRHHLGSAIAKGHGCVRRPLANPPRDKGNDQRQRVRQVVNRIRDQRQRPRKDPRHDLRKGQQDIHRHRCRHALIPGIQIRVMVMMPMMMVVMIVCHDAPLAAAGQFKENILQIGFFRLYITNADTCIAHDLQHLLGTGFLGVIAQRQRPVRAS